MIYYLFGDDDYEIYDQLRIIRDRFGSKPDIVEADVDESYLRQYLTSYSLFGEKRMLIVKRLSENSALWKVFGDLIDNYDDQITIVCVDPKPDKRTATHKKLLKVAESIECVLWEDKLAQQAINWTNNLAKQKNVVVSSDQVVYLLSRSGGDKWAIADALEKLSFLTDFNLDTIDDIVDISLDENIYELLEVALRGDSAKLSKMVSFVESKEDPYKIFGLLSSQLVSMCALIYAKNKTIEQVASDLGVHPYPLKKLKPLASEMGAGGSKRLVELFVSSDRALKTSAIKPWQIIEQMLYRVAEAN